MRFGLRKGWMSDEKGSEAIALDILIWVLIINYLRAKTSLIELSVFTYSLVTVAADDKHDPLNRFLRHFVCTILSKGLKIRLRDPASVRAFNL